MDPFEAAPIYAVQLQLLQSTATMIFWKEVSSSVQCPVRCGSQEEGFFSGRCVGRKQDWTLGLEHSRLAVVSDDLNLAQL